MHDRGVEVNPALPRVPLDGRVRSVGVAIMVGASQVLPTARVRYASNVMHLNCGPRAVA